MSAEFSDSQLIVAIASAVGPAGVGVVRLSGEGAQECLQALTRRPLGPPRQMTVRTVHDPDGGDILDRALVWWSRSPASYTGEDMAEVHTHGSPVILDAVVEACCLLGARVAEPGEFTRRGLLNGKLGIMEAEAVLAAIEATSAAGARAAARMMTGDLGESLGGLRVTLISMAATVEAAIDYPEDVEVDGDEELASKLRAIAADLQRMAGRVRDARRLIRGVDVAIVGPANSGKSTLFNRLLGEDRAIVHPAPGTTRDVVSGEALVNGVLVRLHDTAGLREVDEAVEGEGIRRAADLHQRAAVVLYVMDATCPEAGGLRAEDVLVINKQDRSVVLGVPGRVEPAWPVSALRGDGVDALLEHLGVLVGVKAGPGAALWTTRQGEAATAAARHLTEAARQIAASEHGPGAFEIGEALRDLDELLGIDPTEAVLDDLFSRFCVGK